MATNGLLNPLIVNKLESGVYTPEAQLTPAYGPHANMDAAYNAIRVAFDNKFSVVPRGFTFCVNDETTGAPVEWWLTEKGNWNSRVKKIPESSGADLSQIRFGTTKEGDTVYLTVSVNGGEFVKAGAIPTSEADLSNIKLRIQSVNNVLKLQYSTNGGSSYTTVEGNNGNIDAPGVQPLTNVKINYNSDDGWLYISYDGESINPEYQRAAYIGKITSSGGSPEEGSEDSSAYVETPTYIVDKYNVGSYEFENLTYDGQIAVDGIVIWGIDYQVKFHLWLNQNYPNAPVGTKIYFMSLMTSKADAGYATTYPKVNSYDVVDETVPLPSGSYTYQKEVYGHTYAGTERGRLTYNTGDYTIRTTSGLHTMGITPTIPGQTDAWWDTRTFVGKLHQNEYSRSSNSIEPEARVSDYYSPHTSAYRYSIYYTTKISEDTWAALSYAGNILPAFYYNLKAAITGNDIGNTTYHITYTTNTYEEDGEEYTEEVADGYNYDAILQNGIRFGYDVEENEDRYRYANKIPYQWTTTINITSAEDFIVEAIPPFVSIKDVKSDTNVSVNSAFKAGEYSFTVTYNEPATYSEGLFLISNRKGGFQWLIFATGEYKDSEYADTFYLTAKDAYTNKWISNARVYVNSTLVSAIGEVDAGSTTYVKPAVDPIRVNVGDKLEVKASGYTPYSETINAQTSYTNKTVYLEPLEPEYSAITISVTPGTAEIYLDNTLIGVGSVTNYRTYVGEHKVKIINEGYLAINKTVYVTKSTLSLNETMEHLRDATYVTYEASKGSDRYRVPLVNSTGSDITTVWVGVMAESPYYKSTGSLEIISLRPKNNTDFTVVLRKNDKGEDVPAITLETPAGRPMYTDPHIVYGIDCVFKSYSSSYASTNDGKTPAILKFYGLDGKEKELDIDIYYNTTES